MTKPEAVFKTIVFLTIAGGLGFALYRAGQGDASALLLLGAVGAIVFMVIAFLMFIGAIWAVSKMQQTAFMSNAQENLSIISSITSTQNRQNQMLARQVPKQLSEPEPQETLVIDDGIFSDLEESWQ